MDKRQNSNAINGHKMFSVLKKGLPDNITKTQNIVVCKDDVLYVWHAAENCILTLHMKTFELEDNTDFQRLLPTEAPNFTVDRILVNPLSTLLVLSGPKGICILRLPRRSGALSQFQGGKPAVLCKSQVVDERLFLTQCDIYQLAWHPGSNSDAHILVLTSDNTLRLYDLAGPSPEKISVYPLGKRSIDGGKSQISNVLGDNIVSFTFGRACVKTDKDSGKKEIQWPILLLQGSGDICMIDGSIYSRSAPRVVVGPLPMYPPADDNYGVESCSIIQLGSHLVVVATCSGILYHCLLLPQEVDEEKILDTSSLSSPKHCLYVLEAIELDLGLSLNDSDPMYSCLIYLVPDEGVKNRYFCIHETGVHIVTVPLVNQLQEFFSTDEDVIDVSLLNLNKSSTAEYAICTKTSKSNSVNPPLGLTVTYSPHAFLTILSNGDVVRRALGTEPGTELLFTEMYQPRDRSMVESELSLSLKKMQKVSFDIHIRQILKHELSQPILKTGNNTEFTPQECFELLSHTTHIFHEEYLAKLEQARKEIERRVVTLRLLKGHQIQEGEELRWSRENVHTEDDRIRKKCNDTIKRQQTLNMRCSKVLHAIRIKYSVPSIAEKEMLVELKQSQKRTQNFSKQLENVKKKIEFREQQMKEWDSSQAKKEVFLGKNHTEIIKSSMEKQTDQIKGIMNQVNHLKLDLSMM